MVKRLTIAVSLLLICSCGNREKTTSHAETSYKANTFSFYGKLASTSLMSHDSSHIKMVYFNGHADTDRVYEYKRGTLPDNVGILKLYHNNAPTMFTYITFNIISVDPLVIGTTPSLFRLKGDTAFKYFKLRNVHK
jgi:hypothetical protein